MGVWLLKHCFDLAQYSLHGFVIWALANCSQSILLVKWPGYLAGRYSKLWAPFCQIDNGAHN